MKFLPILFICAVHGVLAQIPGSIVTVQVSDNIYMLKGTGGNVGVFDGKDGVLLIDNKFENAVPHINAAIKEISDNEIRFVINTHLHGDHTGGNKVYGSEGKTIVAHKNVRKRMSTEQESKFRNRITPAAPEEALPILTFDHFVTLHLNGDIIQAMHFDRAHTDGDVVVFFEKANVIHTGDVFITNGFPFIDSDSGGSLDGFIKVLDKILLLINDETKVIPGHGDLSTKADVAKFRNMLDDIKAKIAAEVNAGIDLEGLIASNPLAPYEKEYGDGFIRAKDFLTLVYPEFHKK